MAKIAVVGGGIAGLSSAWILSQEHEVTLYEKNDYIGGHTNTRSAYEGDKEVSADTGFMVFNYNSYPNIIAMFEYLKVEAMKTDMSFGVSAKNGAFEFSSDFGLVRVRDVFSLGHWKMIFSIVRFNKTVEQVVEKYAEEVPLKVLLEEMKLGSEFCDNYLLPLSGAIWSSDKSIILEYPAKKFVSFFNNHGLLYLKSMNPFKADSGSLQWYTIKNGSRQYVEKILAQLQANIVSSRAVVSIERKDGKVQILDSAGVSTVYDHVVCAAHADQTLKLLTDATQEEKSVLGAFAYSRNETYMHKDTSFMMQSTKRWPSWTYTERENNQVEISYYMNRLQNIDPKTPVIVTLNPSREIAPEDIFYKVSYSHPRFSMETNSAQQKIKDLQGKNNTWFAGAWQGHGFHEDGLKSALLVGKAFGVKAPWETPN
jgi:uncharacterized protein